METASHRIQTARRLDTPSPGHRAARSVHRTGNRASTRLRLDIHRRCPRQETGQASGLSERAVLSRTKRLWGTGAFRAGRQGPRHPSFPGARSRRAPRPRRPAVALEVETSCRTEAHPLFLEQRLLQALRQSPDAIGRAAPRRIDDPLPRNALGATVHRPSHRPRRQARNHHIRNLPVGHDAPARNPADQVIDLRPHGSPLRGDIAMNPIGGPNPERRLSLHVRMPRCHRVTTQSMVSRPLPQRREPSRRPGLP